MWCVRVLQGMSCPSSIHIDTHTPPLPPPSLSWKIPDARKANSPTSKRLADDDHAAVSAVVVEPRALYRTVASDQSLDHLMSEKAKAKDAWDGIHQIT